MNSPVVELSPLHEEFLDRTRRLVLSGRSAGTDVVGEMIAQHMLSLMSRKSDQL